MATNLAVKYASQVDEVIRRGLLSTAGTNNDVEFGNAQTVKVYSLDTAPLNDYDPTAGMSRYGDPVELEDTVQEMKMTQQKSFTFTIDKTYEADSPDGVRNAGKALQRQIEQVIIPAIDTYRFSVLADKAGNKIYKELTAQNAYATFVEANTAITDEEFPVEGRVAFCSNAFIELLKKDGGFFSKSGRWCSHLGNAKGVDVTAASAVASRNRADEARAWRESNDGYLWIKRQVQKGRKQKDILREFNEFHEMGLAGFSTREGCAMNVCTLSRWINEIKRKN